METLHYKPKTRPIHQVGKGLLLLIFLCLPYGLILLSEPQDTLVSAARDGDLATVKTLVFSGVDPSRVGWEDHFTPLGAAACAGKTDAVRYLIAHGADIHRRDDNKHTALHWAKRENYPHIVALLKQAGATD